MLLGCDAPTARRESPPPAADVLTDTSNTLPRAARAALDRRFGRWQPAEVLRSEWMWALPPMSPAVIWGDFDGDGTLDHAAQIAYRDSAGALRRGVFAFLAGGLTEDSVEVVELLPDGTRADALFLIPAGEATRDSSVEDGWRRAPRDAIGLAHGDSAADEFGFEPAEP
jgi:hypothetical protein